MSKKVLIAGASGALGREVVLACKRRGHHVTALVRSPQKIKDLPVDHVHTGDALSLPSLQGSCHDVDVVFSCVGASVSPSFGKGWRSFSSVDIPANLNLLQVAKEAKVKRFVYVSFYGAQEMLHLDYSIAHEKVVEALQKSGLPYAVMRPVGFFSALAELQDLAKKGFVPEIGDGTTKTNPIHDADLAEACAEAIDSSDPALERPIGGPEILTRHQISELAFSGLNKKPRVLRVPPWLMKMNALLMRPFYPRLSHAISFFATVSTREAVVPAYGTRTLQRFYEERAQKYQ